jgi:hypothetical protein
LKEPRPAYSLLRYSEEELYKALSNTFCSDEEIKKNLRAEYFVEYLRALKARTLLIENDYIDKDYLSDFAAFYVSCFESYERRCKRLHFFSCEINDDDLRQAVRGEIAPEKLKQLIGAYLGFIVARPLPDAVVGRTLLKTYPPNGDRRYYPCTTDYSANLFGIDLPIRSLAFQEQDTVIAACATVALWSCFHKTAKLFQTIVPTPARITSSANLIIHHGRPIPSHGLNVQQICSAIKAAGLEPEVVTVKGSTPLPSLIYGHVKMGLPVILGLRVEDRDLHAVTVTGFSMVANRHLPKETAQAGVAVPMSGLRMNEIYVHDDQVGPFSRLYIKGSEDYKGTPYPVVFEGSWRDRKSGRVLKLFPVVVVIPTYHKIRVTFLDLQGWLLRLSALCDLVLGSGEDPEWNVCLQTSNGFKRSLREKAGLPLSEVERLLLQNHPRFLWVVNFQSKGRHLLRLLADATDMERSLPIYDLLFTDPDFRDACRQALEGPEHGDQLKTNLTARFHSRILDRVKA